MRFVTSTSTTAAADEKSSVGLPLWPEPKSVGQWLYSSHTNSGHCWHLVIVCDSAAQLANADWLIDSAYVHTHLQLPRQHADRPAATDSLRICVSAHPCRSLSSKQQQQQLKRAPREPVIGVVSAIGQCERRAGVTRSADSSLLGDGSRTLTNWGDITDNKRLLNRNNYRLVLLSAVSYYWQLTLR